MKSLNLKNLRNRVDNMNLEILFSGFGGQGILFISRILSYAALESGLNVTWLPSYGPEMRGGTASCSVVMSDKKILSPIVLRPEYMIAMNYPSFNKYESKVLDSGFMLINSDIVKSYNKRENINYLDIPVQSIAKSISEKVLGNIVILGSLIKVINKISIDSIFYVFGKYTDTRFSIEDNKTAFKVGYDFI
ncbi:2-oxoacid:acceptor oxidoreductase family protein [Candidatus Arthromitus sp. SFB-rat-Yit]|uniref:2-oxoacid:acceptor oxidoreductase family protein n=1 Tax=Candidatus Arthromitus sp. SFB-rat-Yit TaxID=1041504 RepID=UPI001FA6FFEC|nr:2-oxoacid:acceptor oxidoreductase family protein [Candidatus Arthromitus sp. SFB-rat-Yit]